MTWHKGKHGSWWRERDGVRAFIERDYIALTSATYWTIRGLASLEGRSFTTLRTAKEKADAELARLAGPAARLHCNNGLRCIMSPELRIKLARHVLATGLCLICSLRTFQPAPEPRQLPQERPDGKVAPGRRAPRKRPLGGRPKRSRRRPK